MLRVLDLFSGIGGFSLGLEATGAFQTVAFCESDDFCRAVLRRHWPSVPIFDDVGELDACGLGRIDLVCGGFPCQPFSSAGRRLGAQDDRYLWPEMLRIVETCRPSWVLGENVAGLASMVFQRGDIEVESRSGGRHANGVDYEAVLVRQSTMLLGAICDDLAALGYAVQPFVVPACAVGAPHRRDRIWIVANTARIQPGRQKQRPERQRAGAGCQSSIVPDADGTGLAHRGFAAQPKSGAASDSISAVSSKSQRCRSPRWELEPDVGRVADGVPDRVDRLRALGNAVVPRIVEIFGRAIAAAHHQSETVDGPTGGAVSQQRYHGDPA